MPYRMKRRELLSGGVAAGVGGLAGCLEEDPGSETGDVESEVETRPTDRTIRLGVMHPLTGDLGSVGEPIKDGALLPIEQVADEIDPELEYEVVDTETSPSVGVQAASRLVDAGYPMVNGASASDVTLQVAQQVLVPHRTVCCSPASTTPTISTVNDAGLLFRTAVSDSLQAVVLAERAATERNAQRAATLYVNNDYGWQLSRAFARAFRGNHDGTVTEQVSFDEGGADDEEVIEAVTADDPDLVVVIGYPETSAGLFDGLIDHDPGIYILATDGLRDGSLHEMTENTINHIRGTAPLVGGPGEDVFAELYEEQYDAEPGVFTAHAYDATAVMLLANAFAGENDGAAVGNAMRIVTEGPGELVGPETLAEGIDLAARGEHVEYQGASSPLGFDENGDVTDATFEYWRFDDTAGSGITEIDRVST
ncbi:ABC transporter substrate-binding protein [Natrialba sp. INN-245]|uniref:ABC transporter substrate-binding protein n=1 Tax=Natrialba sp. INN-245 TaxID=2690967 RepID=UPI0013114508|nr:ABC transporter substrate-binding protein [Natrialba sp. INN-245]MWV38290.1 ABC transporter substrate-binding protein [Natrialba sp. INN-245]